jgi:hypothetical protein
MNVNNTAERRFLGFDRGDWLILMSGVALSGTMVILAM